MRTDFFEKELFKARERFNETYGRMPVCNLGGRTSAIFAIISLGLNAKEIMAAQRMDDVREQIKRFTRTRHVLNRHFDQLERRTHHVEQTNNRRTGQSAEIVRDRACPAAG